MGMGIPGRLWGAMHLIASLRCDLSSPGLHYVMYRCLNAVIFCSERYGGLSNSQSCTTELSLRTPVERPQTSLPSTPLKPFRDFDVVPESQTLFVSPKEAETPKHIRSFSTSETKSDVSRNKTSRSRLRSDSQFLHHDIPLPDHHEEPSNHERSPLMSPFPILAPPTPFTESATDSQPPTVPARPSSSLKQIPEGAGRRLGVNKVRTDSFTTAVNHGYMEMQASTGINLERRICCSCLASVQKMGADGGKLVSFDHPGVIETQCYLWKKTQPHCPAAHKSTFGSSE